MRLGDLLTILRKPAVTGTALMAGLLAVGGCETKGFLDPGEMMRTNKDVLMVPVLTSLDKGQDETEPEFASAEDVKQVRGEDWGEKCEDAERLAALAKPRVNEGELAALAAHAQKESQRAAWWLGGGGEAP